MDTKRLYEEDFVLWSKQQVEALRAAAHSGSNHQLDWDHLAEEIGRLKREPGNDLIAYGGATFDQALSRLGLVDEYRLMFQPAALGAGLPLFKDLPAPLHLELVEATTYPTGVAIHIYRRRSTPAD